MYTFTLHCTGKVFGTKRDYIVAEAEYQEGEGEEEEEEEGEGIDIYIEYHGLKCIK